MLCGEGEMGGKRTRFLVCYIIIGRVLKREDDDDDHDDDDGECFFLLSFRETTSCSSSSIFFFFLEWLGFGSDSGCVRERDCLEGFFFWYRSWK